MARKKRRDYRPARHASTHLRPVHPGEILREDFLEPLDLSMNQISLSTFGCQ